MIEKCSSCGVRVLFTSDTCPSCGAKRGCPAADPATAAVASASASAGTSRWATAAGVLLSFFAVLSFFSDWLLMADGGSIDLRNRVTGVRLLLDGLDPYHEGWEFGDPERYCDPFENPELAITKTTVTPAMLLVTGWLGPLPYPVGRFLWFLSQWLLLVATGWLWLTRLRGRRWAPWVWSTFVVGFSWSQPWLHHIDRGQGYILWAMLLAIWLRLGLDPPSRRDHLAGFLAGLTIALRPPLLLVIAPFIGFRRRGQMLGAAVGLALAVAAPIAYRPTVWQDYRHAMSAWSEVYRHQAEPRPGQRRYPPEIEDMPVEQLARYAFPFYVDTSIHRLIRATGSPAISDRIPLAALGMTFILWWVWRRRQPTVDLLTGLAAWSLLADALLPAYRNPYNDVMVLNVLALLLLQNRRHPVGIAMLTAALVMAVWIAWMPSSPPKALLYLPAIGFLLTALYVLAVPPRPPDPSPHLDPVA